MNRVKDAPLAIQWLLLVVPSIALIGLLELIRLPAGLLLGPMIGAIMLASAETKVRVPPTFFVCAQAVIGCMIAHGMPPSIVTRIGSDWPVFILGAVSVIFAATTLGLLLTRWQVLPGTAAIWGSSPGAATAMSIMSQAFGADIRLVAFMQYLRVVCVAATASIVTRIWVAGAVGTAADKSWFPPVAWENFAITLAIAIGGAFVGRKTKLSAGPLLVPLVAATCLQSFGVVTLELPPWLLALSYATLGWTIGLHFTREILVHASRAFPRVLASILLLIGICAGFGGLLVAFAGIEPLTAYLATSPGGVDSVAIIAAHSHVDLPFVMSMQTLRLVLVLISGPAIARYASRREWSREQAGSTEPPGKA